MVSKAIESCQKKKIKVILLSPPNYYLYNNQMNENILTRRNSFFDKFRNEPSVFIFNFERLYEDQTSYFLNEDHLNQEGPEVFTKFINQELKRLPN